MPALKKYLPALILSFAAATAAQAQTKPPAAPSPTTHEVIAKIATPVLTMKLPNAVLPPAGPQRDRLVLTTPFSDVQYRTYLLLLRDNAGNYAQCGGLMLGTQYYYNNSTVGAGAVELQANDRDVLQVLRRGNMATGLPARLGGCVAITAAEAAQTTDNTVSIIVGGTVEATIAMPLYGVETAAETVSKQDMVAQGRGVNLKWAVGKCDFPAGGWSDTLNNAAVGARVNVPVLCPR